MIIILTTLVSAAIPIMAPTNDDRRLREASRGVNAFISAAQMKAVQQQRPFGVAIKRLAQDTNPNITPSTDQHDDNAVAIELFYVEQPAPYRGFDRTSAAMVARHPLAIRPGEVLLQFVTRGVAENQNVDRLPAGWDADLFPPGVVRPNDVIEIDGTKYQLLGNPSVVARVTVNNDTGFFEPMTGVTRIDARPINDTGQMINVEFDNDGNRMRDQLVATPSAPYWTNPASYQILRQPMPTSNEPLQMPEGTAIDLRASGVGRDEYFYVPNVRDNSQGILIMFAPEGRVSRVSFSTLPSPDPVEGTVDVFDQPVTDNIFLLIGRQENAPPPAFGSDPTLIPGVFPGKTEQQIQELKEPVNWLRGESRWIVIGSQSGRVVTTENAFVNPQSIAGTATEMKRNEQIHRSREFAREMVQVGGR